MQTILIVRHSSVKLFINLPTSLCADNVLVFSLPPHISVHNIRFLLIGGSLQPTIISR